MNYATLVGKSVAEKWYQYMSSSVDCVELLKMVQYYFAIPAHNAAVERIFSLLNFQWTDERNKLTVENVKLMLIVLYNMKNVTCVHYYDNIVCKTDFLKKKFRGSEKYVK